MIHVSSMNHPFTRVVSVPSLSRARFYKMEGAYFVRMKSSLDDKGFWKDKAEEQTATTNSSKQKIKPVKTKLFYFNGFPSLLALPACEVPGKRNKVYATV